MEEGEITMDKTNIVMMALMFVLIVMMAVAFMAFIDARSEMARVEAEGMESCYMLNCSYTPFGKVECWTQHVPVINVSGSWDYGALKADGT